MPSIKELVDAIGSRLDYSAYAPHHWHDLVVEDERVKVDLTPGCGNKSRVIYVFRNKENGKLLIGKTDRLARERLYSYHWTFNTTRSEGKKLFPSEVRADPSKFEWAILKELKRDDNLEDWEVAFIVALNTIAQGYNQNIGSGGGCAVPEKEIKSQNPKSYVPVPESPEKTVKELLDQSHIYEFYKDDEGMFNCDFSPTAKQASSKIYGIILGEDSVYIGKTDQTLPRRTSKHASDSRSTTEKANLPLYKRLAEAVEGTIALIDSNTNSPERREGKVKRAFENEGWKILNVAGTGGGPASSKLRGTHNKVRKVLFPDSTTTEKKVSRTLFDDFV